MAIMNKTRTMIEALVKEGSFKWVLGARNSIDVEIEEMMNSPSGKRKCIPELSPMANVVVGRCSKILDISMDELQQNFEKEASNSIKHPSVYARNLLEYCCFRALALSTLVAGHLGDKNFRCLTFDMMLAWEAPRDSTQPLLNAKVDVENTVGKEAFCRITPAIPTIADVITSADLFDVLAASTGGRLPFSVYEKYLGELERLIRVTTAQSESSLLSSIRLPRGERIVDVDGTIATQPVLQHARMSTWPGRLTLTDHALYFEPLRVVSYDTPKTYDLSDDLKQVVKPELTGPWGTRLFDKAVMYKSVSLPEPAIMEFPELTGHSRRDYWLAIIREVLYAHKFIRKFQIKGVERDEALSKAVLGILRLRALEEVAPVGPLRYETLLMFNHTDQLPGGDLILETLADMLASREFNRVNCTSSESGLYLTSASSMLSNIGVVFGRGSNVSASSMLSNIGVAFGRGSSVSEAGLLVGEIVVGEMSPLERAVKESKTSFKKVELAQATVNGVKVEGIDTNLAVMKELLFPFMELGNYLLFLASWDDPHKSLVFCCGTTYIVCRGWLAHAFALLLLFMAVFMLLTRLFNQGRPVDEVKVRAPPAMNTMEQLLAVQNAISQVEELVQDGNIVLLKLRALLLAVLPQATDRVALALALSALILAFVPMKFIVLWMFLEIFTRNCPLRKASTERWERRLREWWFSIPAAPVVLQKEIEEKRR